MMVKVGVGTVPMPLYLATIDSMTASLFTKEILAPLKYRSSLSMVRKASLRHTHAKYHLFTAELS